MRLDDQDNENILKIKKSFSYKTKARAIKKALEIASNVV